MSSYALALLLASPAIIVAGIFLHGFFQGLIHGRPKDDRGERS